MTNFSAEDLLTEIERRVGIWRSAANLNRNLHHILFVLLLVVGLLAPLTTVTSATTAANQTSSPSAPVVPSADKAVPEAQSLMGLSARDTAFLAFILTLLTGIIEGVRRHFKFEQKWKGYNDAALLADSLRKQFLITLGKTPPDGQNDLLDKSNRQWDELQAKEQSGFYDVALKTALEPQK